MELNWTKYSVVSNVAEDTTFQITKTELHVLVVTLKTDHSNKLMNCWKLDLNYL